MRPPFSSVITIVWTPGVTPCPSGDLHEALVFSYDRRHDGSGHRLMFGENEPTRSGCLLVAVPARDPAGPGQVFALRMRKRL